MSFLFFMFVTVIMSFLLNWVFMTYLHTCGCPIKYNHESDKLKQSSQTTVTEDVDDFLST
jgi:hypothetical protein